MKKITFLFLLLPVISFSQIIHIPDDYSTIQEGINVSENGDTILVAEGTYFENINFRGKTITLASHYLLDSIYSIIQNTIIDGSQPINPDSASVVYFISEEDTTSILCGFTVRNGSGTTISSGDWNSAGGIYCYYSSPLLKNLIIENNVAGNGGGGIQCAGSSTMKIFNTVIKHNYAGMGSGMACIVSNVELQNVEFISNGDTIGYSGFSGGGIAIMESNVELNNVLFQNNLSEQGGGISSWESDLYINNTTFDGNKADNGGAIHYWDFLYDPNFCDIIINNCYFENNIANEAAAAVLIGKEDYAGSEINIQISNSHFIGNYANNRSGLFISGEDVAFNVFNTVFKNNEAETYVAGVSVSRLSHGSFYNCLFANNDASLVGNNYNSGGASVWNDAEVDFINCIFINNTASYGAGLTVGGGGIVNSINCIYWGNNNQQIALDTWNNVGGDLTISYCDVEYGIDSINATPESILNWGDGNIIEDPMFFGSGNHPFSLSVGSPCIDAGIPDTSGLNLPYGDIINNKRIWDGDNNGTVIIDMGAYEFGSIPVGLKEPNIINSMVELQSYPNPFKSITTITYTLTHKSFITLEIYNLNGELVSVLITEVKPEGKHEVIFDRGNIPAGVYFCTLKTNEGIQTTKMIKL